MTKRPLWQATGASPTPQGEPSAPGRRHPMAWAPGLALLVCVTVGLDATPAMAQAPPAEAKPAGSPREADVSELSLEQLLDVEVQSVFGASKFLQKVTEAPAAVTIVTAEEIERYGWRTLADVLRSVRGFYVTDDRAWAYVGVRGFQRPGDYNARLLLLVDGHRINDNIYDQALIQEDFQVDLADVYRIEVIRGPSSSLYGSNAFFGVINVVTKSPAQARGARITADAGTLGRRIGRVSFGHEFSSGLGVSGSATAQTLDGNASLYFPEFDAPSSNFGVASGLDYTRRGNAYVRADYRGLSARAGYNSRKRGLPTGAYDTVFNDPRTWVSDEHLFLDSSWEGSLAHGWTGRFRGAYDAYEYVGSYPYDWDGDVETPTVMNMDIGTGAWLTAESQLSRRFGNRHRLTVGVEHRSNIRQDQGAHLTDPYELQWQDRRRSMTTGAFVQDEVRLHKKLLLNVGLRYDHYPLFSDPVKPRLAVVYTPRETTTVKFVLGDAFRAPNVFELYYEAPGYAANPGLQPEEIRTVEGIVEHYAGKRLRLSGSAFSYDVQNLIDFTATDEGGLLYYDNLDSAKVTGIEAEAEAKWPGGVQARLSYTYARTRNGETGDVLTNAPTHITQALFSAPLVAKTFIGVDMRVLSARRSRSGSIVAGHVAPSITFSGPVLKEQLRFSLTVSNLTNQLYADPVSADFTQESLLQDGRTARLRLTWGF